METFFYLKVYTQWKKIIGAHDVKSVCFVQYNKSRAHNSHRDANLFKREYGCHDDENDVSGRVISPRIRNQI